MIRIVLVCVAGFSTSMLKQSMQKAAENISEEIIIHAVSINDVDVFGDFNILLVGPQIEHQFLSLKQQYSVPVLLIDYNDYSQLNGENVLAKSLKEYRPLEDKYIRIFVINTEGAYTSALIEKLQEIASKISEYIIIKGVREIDFPLNQTPDIYLLEPKLEYKKAVFSKVVDASIIMLPRAAYSMLDAESILKMTLDIIDKS